MTLVKCPLLLCLTVIGAACGTTVANPTPLDREVFTHLSATQTERLTYALCHHSATLACDSVEVAGRKMYLANSPLFGGDLAFRVEGNAFVLYGGRTHVDVPDVAYLPELSLTDRDRLVINFRGYLVAGMRNFAGSEFPLPEPPAPVTQ